MTREEQIQEAKDKAFPIPQKGRSYESAWAAGGFEMGAKWADEHPINVWHPASEEPQGDEWHIAYLNEVGEIRTLKQKSLTFYGFPTLRSFAKGAGLLSWAYIDDLLPKGNVPSTK